VIKESKAIKDIHRIREEFWRKTRGKSRESIVSLIKEESQKVKQELENVEPDSQLIIRRRYPIPQADSMEEIHQIRERGEKYGK
jgi:hypothetical protein